MISIPAILKHLVISGLSLGFTQMGICQMAIGTTNAQPHASAGLELTQINKGLLIPRVTLSGPTDATTISSDNPTALLVYNTNAAMAGGGGTGFYYNANEANPAVRNWIKIGTGTGNTSLWNLSGNGSTTPGTNFLGTTDNKILVFAAGTGAQRQGVVNYFYRSYYFNGDVSKVTATEQACVGIGFEALKANQQANSRIGIGRYSNRQQSGITPSENSVAIGDSALSAYSNATGAVIMGANAARNADKPSASTAMGSQTLNMSTQGSNEAFGSNTLAALVGSFNFSTNTSTGIHNVAFGSSALEKGNLLQTNTAIGYKSLGNLANGTLRERNVAVGVGSIAILDDDNALVGSIDNTAIGFKALHGPGAGAENTVAGVNALSADATKRACIAIGMDALIKNSGAGNIAIGFSTAGNITTGEGNTVIGAKSMRFVTTSDHNTAVGYLSYSVFNYTNSTGIGYNANIFANNHVRFGSSTVSSIGGQVAFTNLSDERAKSQIQEDVQGVSFIEQLKPVTYHINRAAQQILEQTSLQPRINGLAPVPLPDKTLHTGLEAQAVEQALLKIGMAADIVDAPTNLNGIYGIRYELLVVPLVKTIQEQQATISNIRKLLEELSAQLATFQAMQQ